MADAEEAAKQEKLAAARKRVRGFILSLRSTAEANKLDGRRWSR